MLTVLLRARGSADGLSPSSPRPVRPERWPRGAGALAARGAGPRVCLPRGRRRGAPTLGSGRILEPPT